MQQWAGYNIIRPVSHAERTGMRLNIHCKHWPHLGEKQLERWLGAQSHRCNPALFRLVETHNSASSKTLVCNKHTRHLTTYINRIFIVLKDITEVILRRPNHCIILAFHGIQCHFLQSRKLNRIKASDRNPNGTGDSKQHLASWIASQTFSWLSVGALQFSRCADLISINCCLAPDMMIYSNHY